jgi:hypothetical protein
MDGVFVTLSAMIELYMVAVVAARISIFYITEEAALLDISGNRCCLFVQ